MYILFFACSCQCFLRIYIPQGLHARQKIVAMMVSIWGERHFSLVSKAQLTKLLSSAMYKRERAWMFVLCLEPGLPIPSLFFAFTAWSQNAECVRGWGILRGCSRVRCPSETALCATHPISPARPTPQVIRPKIGSEEGSNLRCIELCIPQR